VRGSLAGASASRSAIGAVRLCAGALPSVNWPENSVIFEPPWDSGGGSLVPVPAFFMVLPNTMETFFTLREAQQVLLTKLDVKDIDSFNMRFMLRFLDLHAEVEALRRTKARAVALASAPPGKFAQAPGPSSGALDLASADARAAWAKERPHNAKSWELTPHFCQVVQARRAEHNGSGWLQVTAQITAEERWTLRGGVAGMLDIRMREHLLVYEIPRESSAVQDFRIAAVHTDAKPSST